MGMALVTGGGGFVGRAVVERLIARGERVRCFSRRGFADLESMGVECVRGDLRDAGAVRAACAGCEIVYHTAAKLPVGGRYRDFFEVNVGGTRNVIAGCRAEGVSKLVYTSTPSVVFSGRDQEGVNESTPYPHSFHAHYPATKAIAEREVREASAFNLHTVALRPHLIWGPGDLNIVPRILDRGRKGQLRRIGAADKKIDCTYIDNVADAHLLAADKLGPGSMVTGKAYFISNGEPIPVWELIDKILAAGGLPPVSKSMPFAVAWMAGAFFEVVYGLLRLQSNPPMTRFLAAELSTAHWYDISAARRELGYEPKVSIDEGMKRLRAWLEK